MRRMMSVACSVGLALALILPSTAGAATTNGRCQGMRISQGTLEVSPGFWSTGTHHNEIRFTTPFFDEVWGPYEFTVSETAPLYPGQIWVAAGLLNAGLERVPGQVINPAQDTVFWSGWIWDMTGEIWGPPAETMQQARADLAASAIYFSWDGGPWILASQGPITDLCANGADVLITGDPRGHGLFQRTFGAGR